MCQTSFADMSDLLKAGSEAHGPNLCGVGLAAAA